VLVGAIFVAVTLSACIPLDAPGNTESIKLVNTIEIGDWKYDFYRNDAYPCSISGYATFVIATKLGNSPTAAKPLLTYLKGGGVGYFDDLGNPIPNEDHKVQDTFLSFLGEMGSNALLARLREHVLPSFRMLAVSYCSHDIYGGMLTPDPHNPNTTPDGAPRLTNGLLATKAAIQFAQSLYPTTKTLLYGTSAGSVGSFAVAWSMQLQGIPAAGVVADASIVNLEARDAKFAQGICPGFEDPARGALVAARVHPELGKLENESDKLVANGRLTVPILHIWNHGDSNTCGSPPMQCPRRDGTTVRLGVTDCFHDAMRIAIANQGPTSRSKNLPVCVDADPIKDCSLHVVSNQSGLVNTDPASPADYLTAVTSWIDARLYEP
jgi:hypothetical protein